MLRTCGLAAEEFTGKEAHDLVALHSRLKGAHPETDPQQLAQDQLPGTAADMAWLKRSYLATRYPNACAGQIPALAYGQSDAERASQLAEEVVCWAKILEDLPEVDGPRKKRARPTDWTDPPVAPAPPAGPVVQEPGSTNQVLQPAPINAPRPPKSAESPVKPLSSPRRPPPLSPARSVRRKLNGGQKSLGS